MELKKIIIIFTIIISLMTVGLSGCTNQTNDNENINGNENGNENDLPGPNGQNNQNLEIEITQTGSSYSTVDALPTIGWFTNGQDADILVNWFGFDNSGGSQVLYHPMGITNDGQHLIVADTCNNRVLIWNSLPTSNIAPDIVLGQTDFNSNSPGTAQNKLRWPVDVATDGEKLIVADAYNDRALVWNTFPTSNGQPADLVLGQVDFVTYSENIDENTVGWPWAVWTNGEKVVITSTAGKSVLIWNSFPTQNDQNPDLILTNDDFGTPRNIETDGETYLIIGDHNAKGTGRGGNFIWNTFPTSNIDYDTYLGGEVIWCSEVIGNDLYGTPLSTVTVFPNFKDLSGVYEISEMTNNDLATELPDITFASGDGSGMTYVKNGDTEISYFCLYNGGRIAGYIGKPEGREPDFTIATDSNENPLVNNEYFMDNPKPVRFDDSLVVMCGFTHQIEVWKNIPDETGAKPDIVCNVPFEPLSGEVYNHKFYVIGRGGNSVGGFLVWNVDDLLNGLEPETTEYTQLGNIMLAEAEGITFDDNYAYISSNGVLYVWEQPFDWTDDPKYEINLVGYIGQISSNGEKLAAEYSSGTSTIILIDIDTIGNPTPTYTELLTSHNGVHFNLPSDVFIDENYLFVADTSSNRALIWNTIPTTSDDEPDLVIGQEDFSSQLQPKFTQDGLFMPSGIWFDGSYLWIGEFKFSHRVLRYSIR